MLFKLIPGAFSDQINWKFDRITGIYCHAGEVRKIIIATCIENVDIFANIINQFGLAKGKIEGNWYILEIGRKWEMIVTHSIF